MKQFWNKILAGFVIGAGAILPGLSGGILAVSMGHTKLRDDYDHRTSVDMIRTLEGARDDLFRARERRDAPETIRRLK